MTSHLLYRHSLIYCYSILLLMGSGLVACKKALDTQPRSDVLIPTTLNDFEQLLDNDEVMNCTPLLGELSADNYYIAGSLNELSEYEQAAYTWEADIYANMTTGSIPDWDLPYQQVLWANVTLEELPHISYTIDEAATFQRLMGAAYFFRAHAFYQLAQIFCPFYSTAPETARLGLPLPLQSEATITTRSTLQATYDQVCSDLKQAALLLPATLPAVYRNRPSRPAAWALLSRVYLSMASYTQAGLYADSVLQHQPDLLDYNNVTWPFKRNNAEVLFQSNMINGSQVFSAFLFAGFRPDSALYKSYNSFDLRKNYLFQELAGQVTLNISYTGGAYAFTGLATDEMYLNRAEAYARAGNTMAAMNDLNELLIHRWVSGHYVPVSCTNADTALRIILAERRKSLPYRGLRWTDLRRLYKDDLTPVLQRGAGEKSAWLAPGSLRYTLLLPPDVITYSHPEQNPR